MEVRDDDDIHRARLLYLGPPGHTLPIHLPYAQWGVGFLIFAVLSVIVVVLTGDIVWIFSALAVSGVTTSYLWRFVDPDRPARTVVRTAVLDAKTVRPPADDRLPRLVANVAIRPEITKDQ